MLMCTETFQFLLCMGGFEHPKQFTQSHKECIEGNHIDGLFLVISPSGLGFPNNLPSPSVSIQNTV